MGEGLKTKGKISQNRAILIKRGRQQEQGLVMISMLALKEAGKKVKKNE